MTATLTKWYEEKGRHEIFAGNKNVALNTLDHHLTLNAEHVAYKKQTDLDDLGTAKNAREEKIRARDMKLKMQEDAKNAQMAKLYREVVLKEQKQEGFVGIENLINSKGNANGGIKPASKQEEVGSFGD